MELATTIRLARTALEDFAERHHYSAKGKSVAISEEETAFRMQYDYFENAIQAIADAEFARSLDEEFDNEDLDSNPIMDWQLEELRALLALLNEDTSAENATCSSRVESTSSVPQDHVIVPSETDSASDNGSSRHSQNDSPRPSAQSFLSPPIAQGLISLLKGIGTSPGAEDQWEEVEELRPTCVEQLDDQCRTAESSVMARGSVDEHDTDTSEESDYEAVLSSPLTPSLNSSISPIMELCPVLPVKDESIPYEQCAACLNFFSGDSSTLRAPCGDFYCKTCIIEFVDACTRDESVFPLRCCNRAMPHTSILPHLPPNLITFLHSKRVELSVPANFRVYCPSSVCAAFLGSSEEAKGEMVCHQCTMSVCVSCKQKAHAGESCSDNVAILEVRALARTNKWQTCPDCSAIVELLQGCYHMICRCRAQFCYLCAVRWKQCECPLWDERYIVLDDNLD